MADIAIHNDLEVKVQKILTLSEVMFRQLKRSSTKFKSNQLFILKASQYN